MPASDDMPEAKRDEVPLPDITKLVERLLRYTDIRVADPRESRSALGDLFRGEIADQLREYGRQCAQAERERCAQIADELQQSWRPAGEVADAIRSQNLIKE